MQLKGLCNRCFTLKFSTRKAQQNTINLNRKNYVMKNWLPAGLIMLLSFAQLVVAAQTDIIIINSLGGRMQSGLSGPLHRTGNPNSNTAFLYSRHFALYDKDKLCASGLKSGATISKIAWFKDGGGSAAGATHEFKVYMKNTNAVSTNGNTWTSLIANATLAYDLPAGTVIPTTSGWWELTLTTPFTYTGQSIEVYTDWFCGGGPNGNRTNGLIAFQVIPGSSISNFVSGGTGKRSPFADDEFVGGNQFTGSSTPDILNVKFTAEGGVAVAEICNDGIDNNCNGQIDEGCPQHYVSKFNGNWNFASTWQRFINSTIGWVDALVPPKATDLTVQILAQNAVTLVTTETIDQLTVLTGGKLSLTLPGVLVLNDGAGIDLTNNGTVDVLASTRIDGPGVIVNGGTINVNTALLNAGLTNNQNVFIFNDCTVGPLQNNGTFNWQSGLLSSNNVLSNNAAGTFNINGTSEGSFSIENKGLMKKNSSGIASITGSVFNTGTITGRGTLNFPGTFSNTGTISPGIGVGALNFNSDPPFSPTSNLVCEIRDLAGAGIGNDLLIRNMGNLLLQGKLTVTEVANAPVGTYEIIRLDNGTISGSFQEIILPPACILEVRSNTVVVTKFAATVPFPGSGNGIVFNGANSVVTVPNNTNFNFSLEQNFTVEFWLRVPVLQADLGGDANVILEKWGSPWGAHPFSVSVGNSTSTFPGKLIFTRDNGAGTFGFTSTVTVNDGRYHHVAIQKADGLLKIFVDGIFSSQINDRTTGQTTNFSALHIGSSQDLSSTLAGEVDELKIWNTALSVDLIRTYMCQKVTNLHPSYVNLITYYPFDQITASTAIVDAKGTSRGSMFNGAVLALSGAPVGEVSAFGYGITPSASLMLPNGEKLTATSAPSILKGIHVYSVQTLPNATTGITGIGANTRYFGVFPVGSSSPQYIGVYDYAANAAISNEANLRLFKRNANDVANWTDVTATQNTIDNTFTFAGTFTEYLLGTVAPPLPINLISFTGRAVNSSDNHLLWRTASEQMFSHFDVQHSTNGRIFASVGKVNAGLNAYNFTHTAGSGKNYYRLQMVNRDGSFTYSNILMIGRGAVKSPSVYPTITNGQFVVSGASTQTVLRIVNAVGTTLSQFIAPGESFTHSIAGYSKGIYFIQLLDGKQLYQFKIIKQ